MVSRTEIVLGFEGREGLSEGERNEFEKLADAQQRAAANLDGRLTRLWQQACFGMSPGPADIAVIDEILAYLAAHENGLARYLTAFDHSTDDRRRASVSAKLRL